MSVVLELGRGTVPQERRGRRRLAEKVGDASWVHIPFPHDERTPERVSVLRCRECLSSVRVPCTLASPPYAGELPVDRGVWPPRQGLVPVPVRYVDPLWAQSCLQAP